MDETLALPSEKAAEIALRTQQLIAYETGVANVIDPLGGSWYVESLTSKLEEEAELYFEQIDELGGVIPAIELGFFQREIAKAASEYQRLVDEKRRIVVGVNDFIKEDEKIEIPILEIGKDAEGKQLKAITDLRKNRNNEAVLKALDEVREACKGKENIMPSIVRAAKTYATLGEIVDTMKDVFGEWQESSIF
jgi:methylmalonyl-CoA mutase N-terminal domain/subunit